MKIEGKIALITGGATGFGKALTQRLLENNAKFITIVDFDKEAGSESESEFNQRFGDGRVKFIHCDVTNEPELKKSFQDCFNIHGALDIVVNNAGILSKDHHKTIAVNLVAVMNGMHFANEFMIKETRSEKGVIVNTASMAGFLSSPLVNYSYTASKHGVIGLTKSFPNSLDGFSKDVRAVAICPAASVETRLWDRCGFKDKQVDDMLEKVKDRHVSVREVIDAFMKAIEDDELNGALLKVRAEGIDVVYS